MKLTIRQLKRIIREEYTRVQEEYAAFDQVPDYQEVIMQQLSTFMRGLPLNDLSNAVMDTMLKKYGRSDADTFNLALTGLVDNNEVIGPHGRLQTYLINDTIDAPWMNR